VQTAGEAAAVLAGKTANSSDGKVRMAAVSAPLGFTCILPGCPVTDAGEPSVPIVNV